MSVREIEHSLEQWQVRVKDLRQRMIGAHAPGAGAMVRHAVLAQGLTAAATAEVLE